MAVGSDTVGGGPREFTARSVVLSLVLGAPEEGLASGQVVRCGEHLGIAEPTVRVALSRAVAAGDLRRDGSSYRLGERLLTRRRRQQEERTRTDWCGDWELVVVTGTGRASRDRAATRAALAAARLAELREGVWMRPANLTRPLPGNGPESYDGGLRALRTTPVPDAATLAAQLWDLDGWATTVRETVAEVDAALDPALRFATAARLVRLLTEDPLLPAELLPADWPAATARARYSGYQAELLALADG